MFYARFKRRIFFFSVCVYRLLLNIVLSVLIWALLIMIRKCYRRCHFYIRYGLHGWSQRSLETQQMTNTVLKSILKWQFCL